MGLGYRNVGDSLLVLMFRRSIRLVSAAWYTSRYAMHSYLYRMNLLSPRHAVQHDYINASSVKGPECSNDHKGSELCIITNIHPLTTPQSAQQHRSEGA